MSEAAINIGLMLEIGLSLLPVGLLQTYQSVSVGYWSARSSEFMQTDLMQTLRWLRMIGDTTFALGAISFVYFALNLMLQRPEKRTAVENCSRSELRNAKGYCYKTTFGDWLCEMTDIGMSNDDYHRDAAPPKSAQPNEWGTRDPR